MRNSGYAFFLPPLAKKIDQTDNEDIINNALRYLLRCVGYEVFDEMNSLIFRGVEKKRILIILSGNEEKLKNYMTEILEFGYGDFRENTGLGENTRYLFIDNGNRPFLFDALLSILACLGLAIAETPDRLFHGIRKVIDSFNPKINPTISPLTSKDLQDHIERSCVPSGAEEIQELLFRDASKAHDLLSDIGGESYALRMLLGACLSGELTPANLRAAIRKINEDRNYEFTEDIRTWLKDLGKKRKRLKISEKNKSRLSDYLANRKILLIEDQLTEHHWDIALPVLLGATARKKIKEGKPKKEGVRGQKIGSVRLWHAFNGRDALDRYKSDLKKFDIILLDLFSSAKKAESQTDHKSLTLSTLGLSVKELTEKIKGLYLDQTKEGNHVPSPLPQIVVFSVDSEGVTARTLFKELGAVDYFFKTTRGEPHKRAYYASFRNALIKALKDNASHVSGIPYSDKFNRFDEWLRQFLPQHRPMILRLMKHFRYYSAMSIVRDLDKCMEKTMPLNGSLDFIYYDGVEVLLSRSVFSYLGRPNKSGASTLALFSKTDWAKKCIRIVKKNFIEGQAKYAPFKTYDDLIDFLTEELSNKGPKKNMGVFLIDDVVGSGGQIKSYLWKLINKDLRSRFMDRKRSILEWEELCAPFLPLQVGESERNRIVFHVIGAIGLIEPERNTLDIRYQKEKYFQDDLDRMKVAMPPKYLDLCG